MNKLQVVRRTGFTLVELVVSVAVTAALVVIITGVLMDSFKAKNRADLSDLVERNGIFALTELRRNIIDSNGSLMICPVGQGDSLAVYDKNGVETKLSCENGSKIASESAIGTVDLTNEVSVSGCSTFISCSTSPSTSRVTGVNIGFTLSSGTVGAGPDSFVEKSFETKITVRN